MQVTDSEAEAAVVESARRGDQEACNALVTRYRAMAVRVATAFIRDKDLAEDIAQEAFVRTFLSIGKLRTPSAFKSYLVRTIVRSSIDYRRKSYAQEVPLELHETPTMEGMPSDEVIYIHDVLARLSPKLREIIVLRDIGGMDYASIASVLRLPIGTVRSRLSAARTAFKTLYLSGVTMEQEGER